MNLSPVSPVDSSVQSTESSPPHTLRGEDGWSQTQERQENTMTSKENKPNVNEFFASLVGQRMPGGCDHCDAYQTVKQDPNYPGVNHLNIHHDDWCPVLAEHTTPNRQQRRAKKGKK